VTNLVRVAVSNASGDILFQALNPGFFYAYYLPSVSRGKNYPTGSYPLPEETADPAWLAKNGLDSRKGAQLTAGNLPRAACVELQAIEEFDSFYPMEIAATPEEESQLAAAHPGKAFLLFPEHRENPIRMREHLPQKWIAEGPRPEFAAEAARGEFFAFQVGAYAIATNLQDLSIIFSELRAAKGGRIPSSAFRCFNTGGTNWEGAAFKKRVTVEKGQVQPLWFGVQIPEDIGAAAFHGRLTIKPAGLPAQSINLALHVSSRLPAMSADDEPWKHSRLRWLDSTLALDDEIARPFTPIRVEADTLEILGRRMELGKSGLPAQLTSYYSPEVTSIQDRPTALLAAPMELIIEDAAGRPFEWKPGAPRFTKKKEGIVEWTATSRANSLRMDVRGRLEFDGFAEFKVTVSATKAVEVRDIRLELLLAPEAVKYMMGLGWKGGRRPARYDWTWDVKKDQDSAWVGEANAGLQFKLKGENYARPLLTNFYEDGPLHMPPAWFNDGRGGIALRESQGAVVVRCYSGARTVRPGQALHFDFDLLVTPFKPLDTKGQWNTRFFHSFKPVAEVVRSGANTVNIHHANEANPYINYPFLHVSQMKSYIEEAHRQNLKVKIYYTIRELSNHAAELFALRSLGHEIFPNGPGGGEAWLQEHLGSNYKPAWFVPQWKDAAIINIGRSRWDNYYVEGLNWLIQNVGIDGLYLDDLAFDRTTMIRVRKVLDRGRPGSLIDFHSANQFNPRDGFSSCANVYLEHFPYVNRLWFGEYFDPNSLPDFWFIELSGIPYGLMGEMLQDGGNRWRGMLYGMTSRMPYGGNDPSPIWKVWDEFKIQDSRMFGYWSSRCPVKTDHTNVLATAYVGQMRSLVSLASWAPEDVKVRLTLDWTALGLDPASATLIAPEIEDFQPAAKFGLNEPIPVSKAKGWLLLVAPGRTGAD
jgi:hypothetical protein